MNSKTIKKQLEFIVKLNSYKTLQDKISFLSSKFQKIGEGSSRIVFKIYDKGIIKIAKNEKGIQQNLQEMKPELQTSVTNKILVADPNSVWTVQRYAQPTSEKQFEEIAGYSFQEFSSALMYKINNEYSSAWPKPENYELINNDNFFQDVVDLVVKNDLQGGDIVRISSWGVLDKKLVLIDTGLSRDIFDVYYRE